MAVCDHPAASAADGPKADVTPSNNGAYFSPEERRCFVASAMASASGFQERQQVGVDRVCLRSRHAVREALVGLQRPVLQ